MGGGGDTSSYKTRECGPEPLKPVGICWLAVSAEGGQVLWITAPPTRPRLPTGRTGFAANPAVPPCRCLLAPHRRASGSPPRATSSRKPSYSRLPPLLCPALIPCRREHPRTTQVTPPKGSTMAHGGLFLRSQTVQLLDHGEPETRRGSRRAPNPASSGWKSALPQRRGLTDSPMCMTPHGHLGR